MRCFPATHTSAFCGCFAPLREGIGALYKGFRPLATRKVVWTVVYFAVYERALFAIKGEYM